MRRWCLAGRGRRCAAIIRAARFIQTTTPGDSLSCNYQATQSHTLYAGLRYTGNGGVVSISVDGAAAVSVNTGIPGEDALFRYSLGSLGVGSHTVVLTHAGRDWDGDLFRFSRDGVGG